MVEIFFISDTHLGHENILNFKKEDGTFLRPGFDNIAEHDELIYQQWEYTVGPQDKIYHLGDVAFRKEKLERLQALPGRKRLVRGNHDLFRLNTYRKVFQEVYGVRQFFGYWLTHVPMWQGSVDTERVKGNIHGHLHAKMVDHPLYFNACVENTAYTPIPFDYIIEEIKQRIS